MATPSSRFRFGGLGLVALLIAAFAILRPWTVRPLRTTTPPAFDAVVFAERSWPRVLEEASRTAVDVSAARESLASQDGASAPPRKAAFVKATGIVTEVDRRSRVGLARVRVADGLHGEVAIQIGPVLRGTGLRDATSFIRFNDFSNQFEFAAVSNALHDRVLRDVLGPVGFEALTGKPVTVLGAATLGAGGSLDIVPIQVQAGGVR
jgi:predicted lipoprotein